MFKLCFVWFCSIHPILRIKAFYAKFDKQVPFPSKKELSKQAKVAKAFMVLLKRKLQREQVCRSGAFRTLMSLVFNHGPCDGEGNPMLQFQDGYYPSCSDFKFGGKGLGLFLLTYSFIK